MTELEPNSLKYVFLEVYLSKFYPGNLFAMECSRVLEKLGLLYSIAASEWFTPFQPGKVVNNIFSFLALFNHKQDEIDACRQDVCQILEQKLAKQGMAAVRLFLKNSFEFIIKSVLAR